MTHEKSPSPTAAKSGNQPWEKLRGKGGSRQGYVAKNEIEDMTLFDEDPGKSPSQEGEKPAKKNKKREEGIDVEPVR